METTPTLEGKIAQLEKCLVALSNEYVNQCDENSMLKEILNAAPSDIPVLLMETQALESENALSENCLAALRKVFADRSDEKGQQIEKQNAENCLAALHKEFSERCDEKGQLNEKLALKGKPSQVSPEGQTEQFTSEIKKLESEISNLRKTIDCLNSKIEDLQRPALKGKPSQDSPEGQELQFTSQIKKLERKNSDLRKTIDELELKYKDLLRQVSELKKETENCQTRLQQEGKLCNMNCVRRAIHWVVCQKVLKRTCCSEQLGSIVIAHGVEEKNIEKKNMRCEFFMDALLNDYIVDFLNEFGQEKIEEAWTELKQKEGVYLLAVQKRDRPGHVVVCENQKKKVTFHDPGAPFPYTQSREMTEESFRQYLENSGNIRLFAVKCNKLKTLLDEYEGGIHYTDESLQSFGTTTQEWSSRKQDT